ncbi:bifunctional phosphopantothenoylcysteine decarboxylase/phosphopantothenate--cysteine ligase CoaBC [candidate division KSB1 bacterium]
MFRGKKILVGITGGIAAYKTCYLIRMIKKKGGEVKTVLTRSGEKFVTVTTLEAISEEPVAKDLFDPVPARTIQHIDLARWPDCFVVAPATANIIAKAAHGIADDLLSTVIVSYPGKILFAPSMNDVMWKNPQTQDNVKRLRELNHRIIHPDEGDLACDTVGIGRMAEPEAIEKEIAAMIAVSADLYGRKILVTAGGTEEPIDPVRVIGNRSSGKMGAALAGAAAARGADVTLIAGIHRIQLPDNVKTIQVRTSAEMSEAVKVHIGGSDALLMAAAVSDYRPAKMLPKKLKKVAHETLELKLERTEDILLSIGKMKMDAVLVGFSLETDNDLENARKKLTGKNLDLVVMNNPLEEGAGFDVDTNKVTLLEKGKKDESLPLLSKRETADRILDRVVKLLK